MAMGTGQLTDSKLPTTTPPQQTSDKDEKAIPKTSTTQSIAINFADLENQITLIEDEGIQKKVQAFIVEAKKKISRIQKITSTTSSYQDTVYSIIEELDQAIRELRTVRIKDSADKSIVHTITSAIEKPCKNFREQIGNQWLTKEDVPTSELNWKIFALPCQQQLLISEVLRKKDFTDCLQQIKILIQRQKDSSLSPSLFISYAWPTPQHRSSEYWLQPFLKQLREHLRLAGIHAILDIADNKPGGNIIEFMEQAKDANFVLLICTESLQDKHLRGHGLKAVATELNNIGRKRKMDIERGLTRVFPFLVTGTHATSYPANYELYSTVRDWRGANYLDIMRMLITQIHGIDPDDEFNSIWNTFTKKYPVFTLPISQTEIEAFKKQQAEQKQQQSNAAEEGYKHLLTELGNYSAVNPQVDDTKGNESSIAKSSEKQGNAIAGLINQPGEFFATLRAALAGIPAAPSVALSATIPWDVLQKTVREQWQQNREALNELRKQQVEARLYLYADPSSEELLKDDNDLQRFQTLKDLTKQVRLQIQAVQTSSPAFADPLLLSLDQQLQQLQIAYQNKQALLLYKKRDYQAARDMLNNTLVLITKDTSSMVLEGMDVKQLQVGILNLQAKIARSQGNYLTSCQYYQDALALNTNNSILQSSLGALLNDRGFYENMPHWHLEAIKYHRLAEKQIPTEQPVRKAIIATNLARGLQQLVESKQYDKLEEKRGPESLLSEAERLLTQALKENSKSLTSYLFRGITRMDQNRYAEALSDFDEVLKLQPTHPTALRRKALIFEQQNQPQTAQDMLEQARLSLKARDIIPENTFWLQRVEQQLARIEKKPYDHKDEKYTTVVPSVALPIDLKAAESQPKDNFFKAIRAGDLTQVKQLYDNKENLIGPSTVDANGYTGLHAAACYGHVALVEYFLERGRAKIDAVIPANQQQALHVAVLNDHNEVALAMLDKLNETSLKHPAKIAYHWDYEWGLKLTPISFAAFKKIFTYDGVLTLTPVQIAVLRGNVAVIESLRAKSEKYVSDNKRVELLGNLLHLAVFARQHTMLNYLLTHCRQHTQDIINEENNQHLTPLSLAAFMGNLTAIRYLEERGADLMYKNAQSEIALTYAVRGGQLTAVEELVSLLSTNADSTREFLLAYQEAKKLHEQITEEAKSNDKETMKRAFNLEEIVNYLDIINKSKPLSRYKPTDFSKLPLRNLVFRGGGPKGIAYSGAFQALEQLLLSKNKNRSLLVDSKKEDLIKENPLNEVRRVTGASAGAIMALLVALNYNAKGVKEVLKEVNINEFVGDVSVKNLKSGGVFRILRELLAAAYREKSLLNIALTNPLKEIYKLTGLTSGEEFRKWAEKVILNAVLREYNQKLPPHLTLNKVTGELNLTFGELRKMIVEESKPFKHLYVVATQITPEAKVEVFNSEFDEKANADIIIADAIRASMSIPGLFTPYKVRTKDKAGVREAKAEYVDGGVLMNYPVKMFDKIEYLEQVDKDQKGGEVINPQTLGFNLIDGYHIETRHPKEEKEFNQQFSEWDKNKRSNYVLFLFSPQEKSWKAYLAKDTTSKPEERIVPATSPLLAELAKVTAENAKNFDVWLLKSLLRQDPLFTINQSNESVNSVQELGVAIAKVFADAEVLAANVHSNNALRTIDIDNCGVSLLDFDLPDERQGELITSGRKAVESAKFFTELAKLKSAPDPTPAPAVSAFFAPPPAKKEDKEPVQAPAKQNVNADTPKSKCPCCTVS